MPIHSCATLSVSQVQDCLYCYKKIYRSLNDVSQLKNNSLLKTEEKKFVACTRTKSTRAIDSYFSLLYRWRIFLYTKRDPWPSNFFFFPTLSIFENHYYTTCWILWTLGDKGKPGDLFHKRIPKLKTPYSQ